MCTEHLSSSCAASLVGGGEVVWQGIGPHGGSGTGQYPAIY